MREQSGPFRQIGQSEKGFRKENANKVRRWRDALHKAGNLTGWPLGNRLEAEFIQSIVEKISRRLSSLRMNLLAFHSVGLDSQLQALYSILQLQGSDVIEGIKLDKVDVEDLILNAVSFKNMKKLRLFIMSDQVAHCGLAGHLSEKLRRRFARNNNNMFARWDAVLKQISKVWFWGA
ncbi:hypothetical protein NL676_038924 [Syzygium grande]|nr:hypothetical protein NL676_038924 [Syzygium grande]